MRAPKNILLRYAAVLAAALGFAVGAAGFAGAAGPQPVAPAALSKATTAARSATALSLLAKAGGTSGDTAKSGAAKAGTTVALDTHPIYALNADFVRDASAPVATFWYAATSATAGGRAVTVYTAPDKHGGWQAVNVASGNTEATMVAAAGGATVFTEPQLGAWYVLTATHIRPLNASAIKSIGPNPITIPAYQALVAHRYATKLPGSEYNTSGLAGGYSDSAPTTPSSHPNYTLPITATFTALLLTILYLVHRRKIRTKLPLAGSPPWSPQRGEPVHLPR
ncbi:hypothetical protein GCM10009630_20210 [Kribbella jejuensis]|uniref:Uncharacterized protein n=1 Tax=Kribbella jejuensis TaxID=236068 RepID=A0A542EKZ9_9ACTN|nr:hypothetical protein [Kribbella jejuensis]TQJ16019.1 hypothetical protein FB475_0105 [Kribbella jejuensis]